MNFIGKDFWHARWQWQFRITFCGRKNDENKPFLPVNFRDNNKICVDDNNEIQRSVQKKDQICSYATPSSSFQNGRL